MSTSSLEKKRDLRLDQQEFKHPSYYQHPSQVECREVIRTMPYEPASLIKYVWRCEFKGSEVSDLKKAIVCIDLYVADHKRPYEFTPRESGLISKVIAFEINDWKRHLFYLILSGNWIEAKEVLNRRIRSMEIV